MQLPSQEQRLASCLRPAGRPVMKQCWAGLGFFHWSIEPEIIAGRLPKNLWLDTFDGKGWIGIVPFFMQRIRPAFCPPLPWLSWFHELNVRTYVYDENGRPGVWFFSLDCNQPIAVELARKAFHLPYEHAKMSSQTHDGRINYHSHRRSSSLPGADFDYPLAQDPRPAAPGTLEWFLVERYALYSTDSHGRLFSGRVHHRPYRIEPMQNAEYSRIPFQLNGFPSPLGTPQSMLAAAPVDVSVFPLKPV
ncbi:YqjF family protein [Luteolibacter algae]|uniref:YqjF family protein n=1 Tax=Luteolibacter algae TaxID=454151 RepID=A0ABW5D9J0_9BACT